MGNYIIGWPENMEQPCFTCGMDFKTTFRAQALNHWIKNPYGQHCEKCARVALLKQSPGTEKQLDEALPVQTEIIRQQFEKKRQLTQSEIESITGGVHG
jgi:hypothetical protein